MAAIGNLTYDVLSTFARKQFFTEKKSIYSFPKRQILESSKLKEFADDNFLFDGNVRKLLKRVENTVGKGEIVCYEQFLLFPHCFQKTWSTDM